MENRSDSLREAFLASASDVASIGEAADIDAQTDDAVMAAQKAISAHQRSLDAYASRVAASIARRSRFELGSSGLAQRTGHLSPESLIQSISKSTRSQATKLIKVGTMLTETDAADALNSLSDSGHAGDADLGWRAVIARAVTAGAITVDAADSLVHGLGEGIDLLPVDAVRSAVASLIEDARSLNADQLHRRARQARNLLDAEGIAQREKDREAAQYLKTWRRADGMYRIDGLLDPENGALFASAIDEVTSPRRGGPRFVNASDEKRSERILHDARSTDRIALDALMGMVQIAGEADPGRIFGTRRPAVRIIVSAEAVHTRGHGFIEGQLDPVSFETIERYFCNTGGLPLGFDDDGQCVNVGREQRLFTARQRVGLAARDGGCMWPGCDRPPSWTEAHHINQWKRDNGKTDIADGILLCRRHHLLLHNNHWEITRTGSRYWLQPPAAIDPDRELIPLVSKSPIMHERSADPPQEGSENGTPTVSKHPMANSLEPLEFSQPAR